MHRTDVYSLIRFDTKEPPDIDLMLAVWCDARLRAPSSYVTASAARLALQQLGVTAHLVGTRMVLLNAPAVQAIASGKNIVDVQALAWAGGGPYIGHVGGPGTGGHVAVRVKDWLLDLSVSVGAKPKRGLNPQPLLAPMPSTFWSGDDAAFLTGDDGSGIWIWRDPEPDEMLDLVGAELDEANTLAAQLLSTIVAADHPGWDEWLLA